MKSGDKVYIRDSYIADNDLRQAHGAQRVVGADPHNVELDAWFGADLAQTRLMLADGKWSPPYDMRPGRFLVPHWAVFPARNGAAC